MYQWLEPAQNNQVIFNVHSADGFGASVVDVSSGKAVRTFSKPVYCVDRQGTLGLSVNFSRLHWLRPGYGYPGPADPYRDLKTPSDDGVWSVDLHTGATDRLLRLSELASIAPHPSMEGAYHYINHAVFNPSGTRFAFFHIWETPKEGRRIRVFTCGRNGNDLYLLTNERHVSHYGWKNDKELWAFSTHEETGRAFHRYFDLTQHREVVDPLIAKDGHPAYCPARSEWIIDTYPDNLGNQQLFTIDASGHKTVLGEFYHPVPLDGEFRCDLHPRWDRKGKYICFDSAFHRRSRSLCLLER